MKLTFRASVSSTEQRRTLKMWASFSLFGRWKFDPYTLVSYILVRFTIDTPFVLWATLTDSASFDGCRKVKMKILFPRSDEITLKRPWNLLAVRSAIMTSANMRCLLRLFSRAADLVEISGEYVDSLCQRACVSLKNMINTREPNCIFEWKVLRLPMLLTHLRLTLPVLNFKAKTNYETSFKRAMARLWNISFMNQ